MSDKEEFVKGISRLLHYPDCWDTAAYPSLASALAETFHCTNEDCAHKESATEQTVSDQLRMVKAGSIPAGGADDWLESEAFYNAMQGYRMAPRDEQREVVAHFENVKRMIRQQAQATQEPVATKSYKGAFADMLVSLEDNQRLKALPFGAKLYLGPAPLTAVPKGWTFERADKPPFKRINVHSPRGHRLCVDSLGMAYEGALYLLAEQLMAAPTPPAATTGEAK